MRLCECLFVFLVIVFVSWPSELFSLSEFLSVTKSINSTKSILQVLGAGFWKDFVETVRKHGGNMSLHCRSGLQHQHGGWGNYSLTLMGAHRNYYYRELCRKVIAAGLGDGEEFAYSVERFCNHIVKNSGQSLKGAETTVSFAGFFVAVRRCASV